MHSELINELATALAKAQGQMRAASKDAVNPHLKNTYATLSSIIEAAREALSANGLAFSQILSQGDEGLILETLLMHSSGQWLQSEVLIRVATDNRGINGAQALGSALTYYKRYALAALLGISVSDEDDDGNGAEQPTRKPAQQRPTRNEAPAVSAQPATPNGNGKPKAEQSTPKVKAPTTGEELLALVNNHVLVTYDSAYHLRNAIRLELKNNKWDFPKPDDREGWTEAFRLAKHHAEGKTTEPAPLAEAEKPF
jgi:hypothetical protein